MSRATRRGVRSVVGRGGARAGQPARPSRPPPSAASELWPTRTQLRRALRALARDFVEKLVGALEQHGVFEEPRHDDDGDMHSRRVRRTADALDEMGDRILGQLRTRKRAVAISEIATALAVPTRVLAHPLAMLVANGRVERSGERRGARYRLAPKPSVASKRSTPPPPSIPPPSRGVRRR